MRSAIQGQHSSASSDDGAPSNLSVDITLGLVVRPARWSNLDLGRARWGCLTRHLKNHHRKSKYGVQFGSVSTSNCQKALFHMSVDDEGNIILDKSLIGYDCGVRCVTVVCEPARSQL